jgi:hypothetical protein
MTFLGLADYINNFKEYKKFSSQEKFVFSLPPPTPPRILKDYAKLQSLQKCIFSFPPSREVLKLFSDWLETITPEDRDLIRKFESFVRQKAQEEGFEIEGEPARVLAELVKDTSETMRRLLDAGVDSWEVAEKALTGLQFMQELSARAKRVWLEKAKRKWEELRQEQHRKRILEELILQKAEETLKDYRYIFSSWNNLAHELRRYNELREVVESDIREVLIKHADRLTEIYNQVPEVPEEVFWGLVEDVLEDWTTRTVSFEEAREELYKRGYRLPYSLYSQYVAKRNKQLEAVSSSPPSSSELAGSQPAPSTEPDWSDWGGPEWKKAESSKSKKSQKPEKGFDLNKEIDEAIELAATALAVYLTKLSPDEWEEYVWKPFTEKMMSLLESVRRRHR